MTGPAPPPPKPRVIWAIYAWPGGRFAIAGWRCEPGGEAEHGKIQWAPTLEAARTVIPAGLTRHEPLAADVDRNSAIVETWE